MNIENKIIFSLLTIALVFLIAITSSAISSNINLGDIKFVDLQNKVYELSWADEQLIRDYAHDKNNTKLIQNDAKETLVALTGMIKSVSTAGGLVSQENFCKLLSYAQLNDSLIVAGNNIDTTKLISSEQNLKIKRDIILSLFDEQKSYHSLISGLGTIFGDTSVNKYKRDSCLK